MNPSKQRIVPFFYRRIFAPFCFFLLISCGWLHPKIRKGLLLRMKKRDMPDFTKPPIWIHASSGEFEYAKPVIREIKSRNPSQPIIVTYFSPTFQKNVEAFPGVDFAQPLPLDLPAPLSDFFRKVRPRMGLIARTDVWPECLIQARRWNIPVYLFSATQARAPKGFARRLKRWMYSLLNGIFCVDNEDLENLKSLDLDRPIEVLGDTRYDQVQARLRQPRPLKDELLQPTENRSKKTFTLVAGSTWPDDERTLFEGLGPLLRDGRARLILVPHEPTPSHIETLQNQLEAARLDSQLYSRSSRWTTPVLIVDQVGILAEIYQWGQMAFVGGSFKGSVHSVMEPLACGLPVLVGPFHRNNREAVVFQELRLKTSSGIDIGAVEVARDADEVESIVRFFQELGDSDRQAIHDQISKKIQSLTGATTQLLNHLNL